MYATWDNGDAVIIGQPIVELLPPSKFYGVPMAQCQSAMVKAKIVWRDVCGAVSSMQHHNTDLNFQRRYRSHALDFSVDFTVTNDNSRLAILLYDDSLAWLQAVLSTLHCPAHTCFRFNSQMRAPCIYYFIVCVEHYSSWQKQPSLLTPFLA